MSATQPERTTRCIANPSRSRIKVDAQTWGGRCCPAQHQERGRFREAAWRKIHSSATPVRLRGGARTALAVREQRAAEPVPVLVQRGQSSSASRFTHVSFEPPHCSSAAG
jgi:hypothetical protein